MQKVAERVPLGLRGRLVDPVTDVVRAQLLAHPVDRLPSFVVEVAGARDRGVGTVREVAFDPGCVLLPGQRRAGSIGELLQNFDGRPVEPRVGVGAVDREAVARAGVDPVEATFGILRAGGSDELVAGKPDRVAVFVAVAVADRRQRLLLVNPAAAAADEDRQRLVFRVHGVCAPHRINNHNAPVFVSDVEYHTECRHPSTYATPPHLEN